VGATTSISSEEGHERRALRQLAVTLEAGGDMWKSLHGSETNDEETTHPLDPTIPAMNCMQIMFRVMAQRSVKKR